MRPGRRGFTLVEAAVALTIGALLLVVAYNAIALFVKGEKSTDREATRAIVEARLMEILLQDVRSSVSVAQAGPDRYHIVRYVSNGGSIEKREVVWQVENGTLVTRQMEGEPVREFNFTGLLAPKTVAVKLRLDRVAHATFSR